MKHDVTASVNVYLCFINNIKHYTSYIKCMFIMMMLEGCGNTFVLFVFFSVRSVPKLLTPLCHLILKTSVIECLV